MSSSSPPPLINSLSYKDRLSRYYRHYAPDKLANIDALLESMKGREDVMMETVVSKYGPELPLTAEEESSLLQSSANNNNNQEGTPATTTAFPQHQQQNTAANRTPTKSQLHGSNNQNDNTNDDIEEVTSSYGVAARNNTNNNQGEAEEDFDVEEQLRTLVSKSGFLCQEHEHKWVQVWLGSLPLSLLTRETIPGKNPVIIQAWGFKNSRKAGLFKSPWKRRFFLVIPPFLYYSESDSPTSKALGCVYLARSNISQEEKDGKPNALKIETRVNRKPDSLDSTGDAAPYYISFETARVMETWKVVLEKVSKAPYNPQTGQIETTGNNNRLLMMGQTFSPRNQPGSGNNNNNNNNGVSNFSLGGGLTPQMSVGANQFAAAFNDFSVGAIPMMGLKEGSGNTPRSGGYLASQQQQQNQQQQVNNNSGSITPRTSQQHQQDMANLANSFQQHQMTGNQQQQQPLSPMMQASNNNQYQNQNQQQQSSYLPSAITSQNNNFQQQQQQQPSPPFGSNNNNFSNNNNNQNQNQQQQQQNQNNNTSFPIDIKDLIGRVKRVSRDKDPQAVIELLFNHLDNFPGDVGVIWKLMLAMDDAPLKKQPVAPVQLAALPSQQQSPPQQQQAVAAVAAPVNSAVPSTPPPQQQQHQVSSLNATVTPSSSSTSNHHHQHQQRGVSELSNHTATPPPPQQQQQFQQQQSYPSVTGSRSASFDLLPLNNNNSTPGANNQNQQNAIQSALTRSSNRRQMIDQMLNGLPK